MQWHTKKTSEVLELLHSDLSGGISTEAASTLLKEHGENQLVDSGGRSAMRILGEQLRGAMVVLLMLATMVSLALHEYVDAVVIVAIIVLNAILGFLQDYRAEKALAALKKLEVPKVRVRRDGVVCEISARYLVPGDVILLENGNLVPADCRIIESVNLQIEEAALTGESVSVEKTIQAVTEHELPIGDRINMAYMGTVVSYGHGIGVVTATGMNTELGHIAHSLQTVRAEPTPLQRRLAQLGRTLAVVAIGIVLLIFLMGIVIGEEPRLMLMTALSMAVAVVPEGLPAVATVALALGARRMFKRNALIRKLPAVETLGSVTVICSDKTGTLTENRMTAAVLDVAGNELNLDEPPPPELEEHPVLENSSFTLLLAGAALCNDAELDFDDEHKSFRAIGDPTEGALMIAAANLGLTKRILNRVLPRIGEFPFDSQRKRMTTVHQVQSSLNDECPTVIRVLSPLMNLDEADHIVFTKGAVDSLLDVSEFVWNNDRPEPMTASMRKRINDANERWASDGMRILGIAMRPVETDFDVSVDEAERELIFIGLIAMIDPPRREVKSAVERCRSAGIRPMMITGDHPLTAIHIARQLGVVQNERVLTGQELAGMSASDIDEAVQNTSVYARVAPHDKLNIVQSLQKQGEVVAMTGDGVNDAPALKQAHIGVAMGLVGTDVSKQASEMVLLDDNFATIVNAVEEGRMVYDNVRKFIKYTMTSNAGEIWVMILGPLLGMPLPLLPLQILWINLVTDGLPGLALAVEQAERNTMQRPPHPPQEHIFGRGMGLDVAWIGLLMGIVSLSMGYWFWLADAEPNHWRTIIFTVLTLSQMGNALAIRSDRDSLFSIGLFSNRALIGSVLLTFVLQMAVIYFGPLQSVFKTTALSPSELLTCVVLSGLVFWAIEAQKLVIRRCERSHK